MTNSYPTFEKVLPPVGVPIVCLYRLADRPETELHHRAHAMSKAIRGSGSEIYYHADTNLGRFHWH